MDGIIYRMGAKRPSLSKAQRLLFMLNKLPLVHGWAAKHIKRQFNLPNSILIKQGFYSSSSLLNVGEGTGLADTFILAYAPVTIGKGCSFSFRNMIITSTHDYEDFGTVIAKPVTIGDNVWVTSNVTILPGVTIGRILLSVQEVLLLKIYHLVYLLLVIHAKS